MGMQQEFGQLSSEKRSFTSKESDTAGMGTWTPLNAEHYDLQKRRVQKHVRRNSLCEICLDQTICHYERDLHKLFLHHAPIGPGITSFSSKHRAERQMHLSNWNSFCRSRGIVGGH